ncbi:hypothetical protein ACN47E_000342 [Coniothyrium glycines]
MDISALVNHDGDAAVLPRRSLSNSISAPSPVTFAAKIPTPPRTKSIHRQMPLKRKRHDPKPIWAYRENEELPPELRRLQEQQRQQSRPPPPATPAQPPPQTQPRLQPSPMVHRNGPPPVATEAPRQSQPGSGLSGFERPVSNDATLHDEVSRKVCDFIWQSAVNNPSVRRAIAADPNMELEVEARWGQIQEKQGGQRLRGLWDSECVIKTGAVDVKFESTMTMEQHKRMNLYLNEQVAKSKAPGAARASVDYKHTREVDMFYELSQEGFNLLNPAVQHIIKESGTRQRIRVTRDAKSGQVLRAIIKQRLANYEISSPHTEWDYRIGINLEITFAGPIDGLAPVVEPGKGVNDMQRQKDRMSYSWLGAYQVDLTQVTQGASKNHELELELNAGVLLENADKAGRGEANSFEPLVNGMMNNLRVLSREITPKGPQ